MRERGRERARERERERERGSERERERERRERGRERERERERESGAAGGCRTSSAGAPRLLDVARRGAAQRGAEPVRHCGREREARLRGALQHPAAAVLQREQAVQCDRGLEVDDSAAHRRLGSRRLGDVRGCQHHAADAEGDDYADDTGPDETLADERAVVGCLERRQRLDALPRGGHHLLPVHLAPLRQRLGVALLSQKGLALRRHGVLEPGSDPSCGVRDCNAIGPDRPKASPRQGWGVWSPGPSL